MSEMEASNSRIEYVCPVRAITSRKLLLFIEVQGVHCGAERGQHE